MGTSCIARQVLVFSVERTMFVLGVGECDMHPLWLRVIRESWSHRSHYDRWSRIGPIRCTSSIGVVGNIIILSLCVFHSEFRKATRADNSFDFTVEVGYTKLYSLSLLYTLAGTTCTVNLYTSGITIWFSFLTLLFD